MKTSQRPLATDVYSDDFLYWVQPTHPQLDINGNMVLGKRLNWSLLLSKAEATIQASTIAALAPAFDGKVDKVAGKELSTNDFTNQSVSDLTLAMNYLKDGGNSGLISGGVVTPTGGIGFNVAPGIAHVHKHTPAAEFVRVVFSGGNFTTLFDGDNWIYVNSSGTIEVLAAESTSDEYVQLGYIATSLGNTVIVGFSSLPRIKIHSFYQNLHSYIRHGLGVRVKQGLAISEQANPNYLRINMTQGVYFLNVQEVDVNSTTSFVKALTSSDYGVIVDSTAPNQVNTTHWNNPANPALTALVEMTVGYWKKDVFFITPNGTLYYVYSVSEWATEDEAIAAPYPPVPESIADSICYLATVISQKGDVSIANRLRDVRPTKSRLFGEAGYVAPSVATSHSDLLNLNSDDHPQYYNQARGDLRYSQLSHTHDYSSVYASITHNHDAAYSPLGHGHSGVYQPLDADLTALAGLASTGFAVRTAGDTWTQRSITGTTDNVTVTNPDGVSGNPVIAVPFPGNNTNVIFKYNDVQYSSPYFTFDPLTNTLALTGTDTEFVFAGVTNEPTSAAADTLKIYAKKIAGRMLPKFVGPLGLDMPFQTGFAFNRIGMVAPNTTSSVSSFNLATSTGGTLSTPTLASTNYKTQVKRTQFTAAWGAGSLTYIRSTNTECWRGDASDRGGFFLVIRVALEVTGTGNRAFFGLTASTANPTNVDPLTSTTLARVGMAISANTGNWSIVHNTAGIAPTVINLGASFPVDTTTFYELILFTPPNGSAISYRVVNMITGASSSGDLTTNLPANTDFLGVYAWMTNNATNGNRAFSLSKIYLESDS